MSDLTKMPEFGAWVRALAEFYARDPNGVLLSISTPARALLAALDAKPEPPKVCPLGVSDEGLHAGNCPLASPAMATQGVLLADEYKPRCVEKPEPPKPAEDHPVDETPKRDCGVDWAIEVLCRYSPFVRAALEWCEHQGKWDATRGPMTRDGWAVDNERLSVALLAAYRAALEKGEPK